MSALWITSYLLIVILGASLIIISYLRLELWLHSRRVRSRRHQRHQRHLLIDSVPGSVIAAEPCADAPSSRGRTLTKPLGVQVLLKRDRRPRSDAESVKGRSVPDRKMPLSKREPQTEKSTSEGQVSHGHSGPYPPAGTNARSNARHDRAETKTDTMGSRASDSNVKNQASRAPQAPPLTPGVTLDDLYDREVPTFITSELVDEGEAQQELSPDDIIQAGVP